MERPGKSRGGSKRSRKSQNDKIEKRRNFALVGGIAGIVVLIVYLITAAYPSRLFSEARNPEHTDHQPVPQARPVLPASKLKSSSEKLYNDNNEVMSKLFRSIGKKYVPPSLQLFQDTISAYECGAVLPAAGSFYCAESKQIYLDLSFFAAVKKRYPESADLVQAYIIAHQNGHHIAGLLGISAKIAARHGDLTDAQYGKLLRKQELLADFYAGVWLHHAWKKSFDNGDAELAISDVAQISTDLAENTENEVPDAYRFSTIGERSDWLFKGYRTGDLNEGDVFTAEELK
ncbi:MAG TPA: neutral zinc metallopeptidase [Mucilaginibacter sp.]|nr:neutral zinc metallopeptidase [Mucilaginibacter sp.]